MGGDDGFKDFPGGPVGDEVVHTDGQYRAGVDQVGDGQGGEQDVEGLLEAVLNQNGKGQAVSDDAGNGEDRHDDVVDVEEDFEKLGGVDRGQTKIVGIVHNIYVRCVHGDVLDVYFMRYLIENDIH